MRHILVYLTETSSQFSFLFFFFFGGGGGGDREWGSDQNNSNKWNLLQGKKRFHLFF